MNWQGNITALCFLSAKRRLKAGNENEDKACRRARQINNTSQLKDVIDELDLPWLLATYEGEGGGNKTQHRNIQVWLVKVKVHTVWGKQLDSCWYLHWIKHLATMAGQLSHKSLKQNKTPRWPLLFSPKPHRATPRATEKLQRKCKICLHSGCVSQSKSHKI